MCLARPHDSAAQTAANRIRSGRSAGAGGAHRIAHSSRWAAPRGRMLRCGGCTAAGANGGGQIGRRRTPRVSVDDCERHSAVHGRRRLRLGRVPARAGLRVASRKAYQRGQRKHGAVDVRDRRRRRCHTVRHSAWRRHADAVGRGRPVAVRCGTVPAAAWTSPSAVLPQTARSEAVGAPAAPAAPASACGAARRGGAAEHRRRDYGQSSPQGKAHRKTRRWANGGAYEQLVAARSAGAEAAAGGGRVDACWQASAPATHANARECAGRVRDRRDSCRVLSEGQRHLPRLRPYRGRSCTCRTCGLSPVGF